MAARFSGATNVPPPVATTRCRSGSRSTRTARSTARKYASPSRAKIEAMVRPSRASIRSSTSSARQSSRLPNARASVVLPAAMHPTRYTLSAFTGQRRQRVEETRVRDGNGIGACDDRRPFGAERRNGEGHRETVIPGGMRGAAGQPAMAADMEAVREFVDVAPEPPQAGGERGDAIALLDAQLGGAGHVEVAAVGGHGGKGRQLVDEGGHRVGTEHEGLHAAGAHANGASRFAVLDAGRLARHLRTTAGQE